MPRRALLARGHEVTALDNLNSYYDPALKKARLASWWSGAASVLPNATLPMLRPCNRAIGEERYDVIVHLAAQAGVRYGLIDPASYTRSNLGRAPEYPGGRAPPSWMRI